MIGIEIECTGINRHEAANVINNVLHGEILCFRNKNIPFFSFIVKDREGRKWQLKDDNSIVPERIVNGEIIKANEYYRVEIISPVLNFQKDIKTLEEICFALNKSKAFVNPSCAFHIHLDGRSVHTPRTLCNLVNYCYKIQDKLFESMHMEREKWKYSIKKLDDNFVTEINSFKDITYEKIEDAWYLGTEDRKNHFHESRYCFINLHSFFNGIGTIEFRCFNGTLEFKLMKMYIGLVLWLNSNAINNGFIYFDNDFIYKQLDFIKKNIDF